jgi:nitroreductase
MPSANFAAWELDPASFDAQVPEKRLEFLIRFAVLAPSGHNSQPWKFEVRADAVVVSADMARALPESDRNHRQLYLSVGCALENLCAAAEYYGYRTEVARTEADGVPAWTVRFTDGPSAPSARAASHPALAIPRRRTNRNKYEERAPEAAYLDALRRMNGPDLQVRLIAEEPLKTRVADVVSDALIEAMDDDGFRRELSGYVRPNITRAQTGMPMYGFGMPTPPSFLAPMLVRLFNVNRPSRKADEALLKKHTPVFVVLSTRRDDPDAWVGAGRAYERAALEAENRGISTAPMAAAIQIGEHYRGLQKLLATEFRPQVFFRAGYASKAPAHSPRIPAAGVTQRT